MLSEDNFITKLLGLKDVLVTYVKETENSLYI